MGLQVAVTGEGVMGVTSAYQLKMKYPALQIDLLADSFLPNNTTDVEPGYWRPLEGKMSKQKDIVTGIPRP